MDRIKLPNHSTANVFRILCSNRESAFVLHTAHTTFTQWICIVCHFLSRIHSYDAYILYIIHVYCWLQWQRHSQGLNILISTLTVASKPHCRPTKPPFAKCFVTRSCDSLLLKPKTGRNCMLGRKLFVSYYSPH